MYEYIKDSDPINIPKSENTTKIFQLWNGNFKETALPLLISELKNSVENCSNFQYILNNYHTTETIVGIHYVSNKILILSDCLDYIDYCISAQIDSPIIINIESDRYGFQDFLAEFDSMKFYRFRFGEYIDTFYPNFMCYEGKLRISIKD